MTYSEFNVKEVEYEAKDIAAPEEALPKKGAPIMSELDKNEKFLIT